MFQPQKLFVYGTLREADRMIHMLGRLPSDPFTAILDGYRRFNTGRGYPVALPEDGAAIDGVLWSALPMDAIERLDQYEGGLGNMYNRIEVVVKLDAGVLETAWFYVGMPSYWREYNLVKTD